MEHNDTRPLWIFVDPLNHPELMSGCLPSLMHRVFLSPLKRITLESPAAFVTPSYAVGLTAFSLGS